MSRYFVAPDGADEPTIWEATDGPPTVVVRRAELPGPHADLLWRVLTGVLCADDDTVERVARALGEDHWQRLQALASPDSEYDHQAHAALAALRDAE